jgi:hypothetical protein
VRLADTADKSRSSASDHRHIPDGEVPLAVEESRPFFTIQGQR